MSYAILRAVKLKTMGAIAGSGNHTYREVPTPNADPSRRGENLHYNARNTNQLLKNFRAAMPEKVRKNAVLGIEYLITASPERFKEPDFDSRRYFEDALKWLVDRHGKENIMASAVHNDETTPHMAVYVIPKDDQGKLNCRKFLGGRAKLSAMQTDFAKKVGEKHGLKRGIKGSKAKHKTIKQFYAELNSAALNAAKKPPLGDRVLDLFGIKTEQVKLFEQAAELAAAAGLEQKLDSLREQVIVDTAEQEIERIKEQVATREQELETQLDRLSKERAVVHQLGAELENQAESMIANREQQEELKAQLKASETLSERLTAELDRVKRELHEERLNSRSSDYGRQI